MLDFLFDPSNLPFTIAIVLVIALGLLEGVSTAIGMGMSSLIDAALPDFDFGVSAPDLGGDIDIDADVDLDLDVDADVDFDADAGVQSTALDSPSLFLRVLGWSGVGRVPLMVVLVLFLGIFGALGLVVQRSLHSWSGFYMPWWIGFLPVGMLTMPLVRMCSNRIARIIPKEETAAVSVNTFIGRVATITVGTAAVNKPAEAKLRDEYGLTHYVMVEPDDDDETFETGTKVILVSREGGRFRCIRNESAAMVDRIAAKD